MSRPQLSIIIPTYNRPDLLPRAVRSALAQTLEEIEVLVVDDGSPTLADLPADPRLHVIQLPENRGGSAARNVGLKVAKGRWVTYLDDDDCLLPHMAAVSLAAFTGAQLPEPVAVLSGLEVVNRAGEIIETRIPPTLPRGAYFSLEAIESGKSFHSKQTLVVERDVLLGIGGFDESFQSRVHTELFLRLNPVCSLIGIPTVTYQLFAHEGPRVSHNLSLREKSFQQLIDKHKAAFQSHPRAFSEFILKHAQKCSRMQQQQEAISHFFWALKIYPYHIFGKAAAIAWDYLRGAFTAKLATLKARQNSEAL